MIDTANLRTIETERLLLRQHRLEDFDASAALWADETVTRFIGGRPQSREEVWTRLLRYAGHWALLGYGYWAVEDKTTGHFVGDIGFGDRQRDVRPAFDGRQEIGWVLSPSVHGKGYATEAVTAALAWGDAHLPSPLTTCIIHPDHAVSIRVAEKHGFRRVTDATYHGAPTVIFERMKPV